jgi:trypsin
LVASLLVGVVACGDSDDASTNTDNDVTVTTSVASGSDEAPPIDFPADAGTAPELDADEGIVGGTPIDISRVPWTAAILFWNEGRQLWHQGCGGALIGPKLVMTAAHCVTDIEADAPDRPITAGDISDPTTIQVALGRNLPTAEGGEQIAVTRIWVSKRATSEGGRTYGDYAVLELAQASQQMPVALPSDTATDLWATGRPLLIVGWGCTSAPEEGKACEPPGGAALQQARFQVLDSSVCSTRYGVFDPTTELCVGDPAGVQSTCPGDSGGPYIVQGSDSRWYQVALVSWGSKDCAGARVAALVPVLLDENGSWDPAEEPWLARPEAGT